MTSHRTSRLRVDAPTLEPDPVFLGLLAEVGASSRPAAVRTVRSAGLRALVAAATVAAVAGATWAVGNPTGGDVPPSPADGPTQQETHRPPSPGDAGTPQPDVSDPPGSPLSPGLPGTPSFEVPNSDRAVDRSRWSGENPGRRTGADQGEKTGQEQDKPGAATGGRGKGPDDRSAPPSGKQSGDDTRRGDDGEGRGRGDSDRGSPGR